MTARVCRQCGAPLDPDDRGRTVSCCSPTVPPRRPGPRHGGAGVLRRFVERSVGVAGDRAVVSRHVARLIVFVVLPAAMFILFTTLFW